MSQEITLHKMNANKLEDRRTFLRALYGASPEELYLELRCIHPNTGEVKSLWSRMGDKPELARILKKADRLNQEGFGVYFAPCLRNEKRGTAESAAWLPALWIDIDSKADQQQRDLERLQGFEPKPSFVLNSGGGWHGYWLLQPPVLLKDEDDRQRIGSMMRGLFSALQGDPDYVKTVAGIMRLPGTINTKPEREGALVELIDSTPDRQYAIETFSWLETAPAPKIIQAPKVLTLNGNGLHTLPPRTEKYLTTGANNGNRNSELFAAACQMRDAGYSQAEAENNLVQRYVADGDSSEPSPAREKQAQATISSAYSRPAREPILTPQDQVAQIIGQYKNQDRPTTKQITEAVEACAKLNPIEWAEERQKLKAICGDGLKISDLDRLYRQSRKQLERSEVEDFRETEHYAEMDGKIIYQRQSERGMIEKTVADWSAKLLERVSRVDDDGQAEHVAILELQRHGSTAKIDVPSEVFGDDSALRRYIAGRAGEAYTVRAGMAKHLTPAILSISGNYPTRNSYRFMGWTKIDGRWTYITPSHSIDAGGIKEEVHEVELEPRLRDYRLAESKFEDSAKAFEAMIKVFPPELAPTLIAFGCLPLFQRFFPKATHKPALHLVGTTGSGKSEIASLMTSLYGEFLRDSPPAQWGDTINAVEALGYSLADALYWIDDYKHIYADSRNFTRFMQSYSRNMGRGRLTREAQQRQDRACRGHILSTGETTVEGEPSVLARMIVLELPPWEQRDPGGDALNAADQLRRHLPGFTAYLAAWIAKQADTGELQEELVRRLSLCDSGYRTQINAAGMRANSTGRVIGNWAVLTTIYHMLDRFLDEHGCADILPGWRALVVETAQAMQEERASQLYVDIIQQLAASGRAIIEDPNHPREHPPSVPVIGYVADGFTYIIPDIAFREVAKIQPINFTLQAIGNQLKEDGMLVPGPNNLSIQKRFNGQRVRVWQLPAHILG